MKLETFAFKNLPSHLQFVSKPFHTVAKGLMADFPKCDMEKSLKNLRLAQRQAIAEVEATCGYREPWFNDYEPENDHEPEDTESDGDEDVDE